MNLKVHFSDVGEFLEELHRDPPPDQLVRATQTFRPLEGLPLRSYTIVAGYQNRYGQLTELRTYLGEFLPGHVGPPHDAIHEAGSQIILKIEQACDKLGLQCRPGRLLPLDPRD